MRGLAVALVLLVGSVGCMGPSPEDEAEDLCGDLANLEATFDLLLEPPVDATVGEVRGAYEKVAPVLARVAGAARITPALAERLDAIDERFREAFGGAGDDAAAAGVVERLAPARAELGAALPLVIPALGCSASRS